MKRSLLLGLLSTWAWALPEGGQVQAGQAQIVQPQSHILQVLQASPSAILNWNSFSIQPGQLVQFLQPNSQAIALNRVIGADPSIILGQLQANGRLFLLNPNGIIFGAGSSVQAGSFLASTLTMTDSDFLAGNYRLSAAPGQPLTGISHQGEIRVDPQGFVVLLSPLLDNQGLIVAEQGQVVLGATTQATLSLDAQGQLSVVMPDGFRGNTSGGRATVLMSAAQASESLSQLVESPILEAAQLIPQGNGFALEGGEGVLVHSGRIEGAKQVYLNSSQATVLAPNSSIQTQEGSRVEALSAGRSWSGGQIINRNGFVEISAPSIGYHHPVDVGPNGTLLLDPQNIRIIDSGGDTFANPFINDSGTDLTIGNDTLGASTGTVQIVSPDNISIDPGVGVNFENTVQVHIAAGNNTGTGDFIMGAGSALRASNSTSTLNITAPTNMTLGELGFNNIRAEITGGIQEMRFNGDLGRAGADTSITLLAPNIGTDNGANINILGDRADVVMTATLANFVLNNNSSLNLPGGQLSINSPNGMTFFDARILSSAPANVSVQSSAPGSSIVLIGNSQIQASNVTANTGSGGFQAFAGSSLRPNTSDGQLNIQTTGVVQLDQVGFNHVNVTTGGRFGTTGDIGNGAAGSQLRIHSGGSINLRNVQVDRADLQSATNMRLQGSLNANTLNASVGNELIGMVPESEIVINSAGSINAVRIFGNLSNPELGIEQALTLRSGSETPINLSVSGSNITDPGSPSDVQRPVGVAASLYYPAPQSSRLLVLRGAGAGEVRIVGYPIQGPINGREDLSPEQVATINAEVAQSQIQLGNVAPQTLFLGEDSELGLSQDNASLVSFALTNLSSALLEGPVLSPGDHLEAISANLLQTREDTDEEDVRFWKHLIERVIIWEKD